MDIARIIVSSPSASATVIEYDPKVMKTGNDEPVIIDHNCAMVCVGKKSYMLIDIKKHDGILTSYASTFNSSEGLKLTADPIMRGWKNA